MYIRMHLANVLLALIAWSASEYTDAAEMPYPVRPIRWIIPYPPGGPTDILARFVGQKLTKSWGQQVVIDNRPGANSIIATEIAARAQPDGYTLLFAIPAFAINPSVYKKLPYDALQDFVPVTQVASAPLVLLVNASFPVRSVPEMIALAKARVGRLTYGSGGIASPTHLAMELLMQQTGVSMQHVPYKGAAPALVDLIAGRIDIFFSSRLSSMPFVKTGQLRIVAVTSSKRSDFLPDVPTVAESGLPRYEVTTWYGLFTPTGTSLSLAQTVSASVGKILQEPEVQTRLAAYDFELIGSSPKDFARVVREELRKWRDVVRTAGIHPEG